jgi:hypothetical protein
MPDCGCYATDGFLRKRIKRSTLEIHQCPTHATAFALRASLEQVERVLSRLTLDECHQAGLPLPRLLVLLNVVREQLAACGARR